MKMDWAIIVCIAASGSVQQGSFPSLGAEITCTEKNSLRKENAMLNLEEIPYCTLT